MTKKQEQELEKKLRTAIALYIGKDNQKEWEKQFTTGGYTDYDAVQSFLNNSEEIEKVGLHFAFYYLNDGATEYWAEARVHGNISEHYLSVVFESNAEISTVSLDDFIYDIIAFEKYALEIIKKLKIK